MALQLQQKLLITSISLFPASFITAVATSRFEPDHSNDPVMALSMVAACTLPILGLLGILLCAIFWKWPDSKA